MPTLMSIFEVAPLVNTANTDNNIDNLIIARLDPDESFIVVLTEHHNN